MVLTLVSALPDDDAVDDAGDRISSDGLWSLTHEWALASDDDTDDDRLIVVATHLATGLQLTHDAASVDAWLMTGLALAELKVQAVSTYNGIAPIEDKTAARDALVKLDLLLPTGAVDAVEYRCECGGYLAVAPGRRLVHVDVCAQDIDPIQVTDPDLIEQGVAVVCGPDGHRICLEAAARQCGHALCKARGCAYAPPCEAGYDDCCGPCCHGDRD